MINNFIMNKVFIILGPPGSGKGTQAKRIAQKLDLIYFGTGDLMRQEAEKATPMGLEFKKVWDEGRGGLVSEELVQKFVEGKINEIEVTKGVVFDGYPRTIPQAEHLEGILQERGIDHLFVVNLVVTPESSIKRMSKRRVDENRVEDEPSVFRKRIEVYQKQTAPLVDYYQKQGKLIDIDGEPPIEEVWEEIQDKILNHK